MPSLALKVTVTRSLSERLLSVRIADEVKRQPIRVLAALVTVTDERQATEEAPRADPA